MKKTPLLIAGAVGYVLGSKAGRGRYEQIKSGAQKVAENPRVQAATHKAQETVTTQAAAAADVAKDKVSGATTAAADKVRQEASIQPAP
ncbi:hypothetical protein [Nocardioides sp.]|uniref:hypothetical protein n=1 Tax=Nocardioides sp. TaxID=35761 RepID=UPI00273520FC|nr:hypothetical protein [Nocardioides sp.]MDP3890352.1 hypothetical protein [Nocardioides sp.]